MNGKVIKVNEGKLNVNGDRVSKASRTNVRANGINRVNASSVAKIASKGSAMSRPPTAISKGSGKTGPGKGSAIKVPTGTSKDSGNNAVLTGTSRLKAPNLLRIKISKVSEPSQNPTAPARASSPRTKHASQAEQTRRRVGRATELSRRKPSRAKPRILQVHALSSRGNRRVRAEPSATYQTSGAPKSAKP